MYSGPFSTVEEYQSQKANLAVEIISPARNSASKPAEFTGVTDTELRSGLQWVSFEV